MTRNARARYLFLMPSAAIYSFLFVAPFANFFVISFWRVKMFENVPDFTLANYIKTFEKYLNIVGFTFSVALVISVVTTVLAFGFAYAIRFKAGRHGSLFLFLALIALFGGYLIKIYAWKTILGKQGILNMALISASIIDEPIEDFLYSPSTVVVTLVNYLMPLAILLIYGSLRGIENITLKAARDLGAKPWRVFTSIVLPQCQTGLIAAFTLSFLLAAGDYVTPQMVGGPTTSMMGVFIASQFGFRFNTPLGAAMSFGVLFGCIILVLCVRAIMGIVLRPR